MTPDDVLRLAASVEAECWDDGETAYVCRQCLRSALARAHAEGKAEGLRVIDEAVTTLEAPRNGPQYGEIHEVIEAARQGVLTEYLLSQDGDLARILAARSAPPAAPLPAGAATPEGRRPDHEAAAHKEK